ncbi:LppA family lipoprotein [Amycolatopsis sp. NPDC004169]|uniref:LppA family lipoprotein n=1 Tax=Amycolatopsis sp. NPDC004169 TaxID=3154453 RepID=UPI0033A55BB8
MLTKSLSAAAVVAGALLLAACDSGDRYLGTPSSETTVPSQQQYAELLRRPTIDEAVTRYEEARKTLQTKLTEGLGITGWVDKHDGRQSGCANEFPGVDSRDAVRTFLSFLTAPRGISGEQWADAKRIATEVGAGYGFTKPGVQTNNPPTFEFELKDQYGAALALSSGTTTVISIETGCHLTTEAKGRIGAAATTRR